MLSLDITILLHELMKKYFGSATSLVENIMANIEESVAVKGRNEESDTAVRSDPEKDNHTLSILANLLFAYDGLSEKVITYLDRLQAIAKNCNAK